MTKRRLHRSGLGVVPEPARRVGVWGIVALFFAAVVWYATIDAVALWWLFGWAGYPVVGAIILTVRPGNAVGRLLLMIGAGWVPQLAVAAMSAASPPPIWAELLAVYVGFVAWLLLALLVTLFPAGRFETSASRVLGWMVAALAVLMAAVTLVDPAPLPHSGRPRPWAVPAAEPVTAFLVDGGGFLIVPALLLATLVELVVRWRRAEGQRRLQFRWFAFGVTVSLVSIAVSDIVDALQPVALAITLALNAMPISIGIAVTRHGLYEINRVISRTVSYALVSAIAIGVYALVVTSVTWVLPDAPSIAVAAATLVAAALALPLLRAIQRLLDRRFDRERYDAQRVVDGFGERLRTQVETAQVTEDLSTAVDRTLAPTSLGLWTAAAS